MSIKVGAKYFRSTCDVLVFDGLEKLALLQVRSLVQRNGGLSERFGGQRRIVAVVLI